MKTDKMKKIAALILSMLMAVLCLTACGEKTITVTVTDMGTKTEIEAKTGMKVADVLSDAGITLGEKDVCEPEADAELIEDMTGITVLRYAEVTVVKDGEERTLALTGKTVADALTASGFEIAENEEPDVDPKTYLKNGMVIGFVSTKNVQIIADGETKDVTTKVVTVEELLKEQNITLGADDEVSEKLDARLSDGIKITVKRVEYKEEKTTEGIASPLKEEYSDEIAEGESEVKQLGEEGEKEVTYKVKYVDGKEDSREKISEKVIKEPVDRIVVYGTGSDNDGYDGSEESGRKEVSRVPYYDCDGSGHGYWEITYDDGSVEYKVF